MTTRIESIGEKCQTEQGAHVYTQWFSSEDAEKLSDMILNKSVEGDIIEAKANWLSTEIVKMCEAMPLAVICLSAAWAEGHVQGEYWRWDPTTWPSRVWDGGVLSTPSLKPLVQSLWLYLDDLPIQLRTCLLYCSIYPGDYMIKRVCLVRKWIAEGFVSRQEIAEAYFEELVRRNVLLLLQSRESYTVHPMMRAFLLCKAKEDNFIAYNGPGNSSHVRQISRRLSLGYMDWYPDEDVRLSHISSLVVCDDRPKLMDAAIQFNMFKNLRVLEIDSFLLENGHLADIWGLISLRYLGLERCNRITEVPREIGRLQNLETLYVSGTAISKLPMEIGELKRLEALSVPSPNITELPTWIQKLQCLKTLDTSATKITELPREIGELERLEALDISYTEVTELPTWIEKLQNLKTLDISRTPVKDLPKEIEKLQHLRTLKISDTMVTKLPREIMGLYRLENLDVSFTGVRELPKEIAKLQHLRTLDIRMSKVRELSWEAPNTLLSVFVGNIDLDCEVKVPLCAILSNYSEAILCREDVSIVVLFNQLGTTNEVVPVPMLRIARTHMNLPQWVKQDLGNVSSLDIRLCKLGDDDLEFLKQMPNLQALQLRLEVLPREPIAITGGGFSKLGIFYVDCRMPRAITFQSGAMPKLKHLEFKFYTGAASQVNYSSVGMGITHLPCLEILVFWCSEYYTSDSPGVSATIDAVRKEAAEHPNRITLWDNDKDNQEVFRSGDRWISLADKAIIKKEFEEWKRETENRKRETEERKKHVREQRYRLCESAERRRDKNAARAAIQKEIENMKKRHLNAERAELQLRCAYGGRRLSP